MKTTRHITALIAALFLAAAARAQNAAPAAALREAQAAAANNAALNLPGIPQLPVIIPYYDAKAYAWVWNAPTQAWTLIPRNEARVLGAASFEPKRQLVGTLTIDGCYDVPVVSGQNVILLFRKKSAFKTYAGLPAGQSGIEVTRLDVRDGPRKGQLIRTAQLERLGESAATFVNVTEPLAVQTLKRQDGVFYAVRVMRALPAGRYALYLPDRAFEFEVK